MPVSEPIDNNSVFKKISRLWFRLIGDRSEFPLQTRIFHSISIGLVILGAFYAPYNFFAGLYVGSVSSVLLMLFFFVQFYNSRYHGKPHSDIALALTGILIFSVNYFTNSGINGSTDLIWPAYLALVLAISPYKQHLVWALVYIAMFFILHLVEYRHPLLVRHPFGLGKGEFIDRVTAFPIPVIAISLIIGFIRRSYDKERQVTEEKAKTILQQKEQLEQSNAEKNKLMSIISHDIRAPFVNIQNYLQLLTESRPDGPERIMLEKELLDATDQTMEMLSNLLYWSRSQMEGFMANLTELHLLEVLKSTLEIESALAGKKNISFSYSIDPGITIAADADMLQLVVRNLINNAIKFTPRGGHITVKTEVANNECKITVVDNGKGIDAEKKEKIFSLLSEATFGTDNEKGVGLGLLLCKEFTERQGGRIGFESTPGKGSSFFVFMTAGQRS